MIGLVSCAAIVAGCGGNEEDSGSVAAPAVDTQAQQEAPVGAAPEQPQNMTSYTQEDIIKALQLEKDPDTLDGYWDPETECTVDVFTTTRSEVQTYVSAGDPVAYEPQSDSGRKVQHVRGDRSLNLL